MDRRTRSLLERRLAAQMLTGPPAHDPVAVAERLLAIQGQDARAARLAIRARSEGLRAADVDRALSEDRSLLISWLCRGTLHLVRSEDYPLLQALTTPQLETASKRRLAQEGVSPEAVERGIGVITKALADGPLARGEIRSLLAAAKLPVRGQALPQLLFAASLRGLIIRGPIKDRQHAFALVADWLGPQPRIERDRALAELARRFLAGHGPASDRDLAKWAQITLGEARRGLAAIAAELTELEGDLVDLRKRAPVAGLPAPKLLGAYEPVLLGWVSRSALLDDQAGVVTRNGIVHPIALAGGQAVAKWALPGGQVKLEPFGPLAKSQIRALEAEAADVARFLG